MFTSVRWIMINLILFKMFSLFFPQQFYAFFHAILPVIKYYMSNYRDHIGINWAGVYCIKKKIKNLIRDFFFAKIGLYETPVKGCVEPFKWKREGKNVARDHIIYSRVSFDRGMSSLYPDRGTDPIYFILLKERSGKRFSPGGDNTANEWGGEQE